jgi:hypothetical protein
MTSFPRQALLFQYVAGRFELSLFPDNRLQDRFLTFIGKTEDPSTFIPVEKLFLAAAT